MKKVLGKISEAVFGLGGYQECQLGLHLAFEINRSGIRTSYATWDSEKIKHNSNCNWTEEYREDEYIRIFKVVSKLLDYAKVTTVNNLVGIPVEIELDGNTFIDFRILTEVL